MHFSVSRCFKNIVEVFAGDCTTQPAGFHPVVFGAGMFPMVPTCSCVR